METVHQGGSWLIQTVYSEFNGGAWLVDLGAYGEILIGLQRLADTY